LGPGAYRVAAQVSDLNAAGSFLAMGLCLTAGMALRSRGLHRLLFAAAGGLARARLFLPRSPASAASRRLVPLVAATWFVTRHRTARVRALAIAGALAFALGGFAIRVYQFNFGVDYRQQFTATSLRMIEARPLSGVGIGQYYRMSPMFLSPQLA